jgi:hypothetical protein
LKGVLRRGERRKKTRQEQSLPGDERGRDMAIRSTPSLYI